MNDLLESVPNFSVGRDDAVLDALGDAFGGAGVRVLDVHADADHNRSVFTVVADPDSLVEGLAAAIAVAVSRIDLNRTWACTRGWVRPTSCRSCGSSRTTRGPSGCAGCWRGGSRCWAFRRSGTATWAAGCGRPRSAPAARRGWPSGWRPAR